MNEIRVKRLQRELLAEPATNLFATVIRPGRAISLRFVAGVALVMSVAASTLAFADSFPSRPIRLVVPWPPGQSTDVTARMVAERLAAIIGQPVVIDNRPGAGGTIGTEAVARSAADGYTLLAGSGGPISISPVVQRVGYDPDQDFDPICLVSHSPYMLVSHPSVPARNTKEFIALLRSHPGKYSFGSSGNGSTSHLIAEAFNASAALDALHVPYKGSAPALNDLIAGHVSYVFETAATVLPHVQAGRLKAFGSTSSKPAIVFPDLPTLAESGDLPDFDLRGWGGLFAPVGLPAGIRARLVGACREALDSPQIRDRFKAQGTETSSISPEAFRDFVREQNRRFSAVARRANIRID